MIKSDAQRERTVAQIEGFQQALAKAEQEINEGIASVASVLGDSLLPVE